MALRQALIGALPPLGGSGARQRLLAEQAVQIRRLAAGLASRPQDQARFFERWMQR